MPGYEVLGGSEFREIKDIFQKSKTLFRMGFEKQRKGIYKVAKFEKEFAKKFKSKFSLAVTSGTAALRVALSTLDLKKSDEIITQSFTFVATVEAIVESKAKPICCEVDNTLNMDPSDLKKKINKKTKAVIAVHMLGVPSRIDEIRKICKKKKIFLIEDTAWGCGGNLNGKYLGTWGDIGCFSFDFAKTITTGEGGMLLFKSKKIYEKAKAWHDHGHENNPKFPRWEDTRKNSGFNFRMNEMQGAVGLAQLKKLNFIIKMQRKNHDIIWKKLKNINGIVLRNYPKGSYVSADSLIVYFKKPKLAKKCRIELLKNGISTKILPEANTWHFAKKWTHIKELKPQLKSKNFAKSEKFISTAVSIPLTVYMDKRTPELIYRSILKVFS